ncbi:hypothetical protein [[Actinomadura] parvosata]|uniref:hypothetical protein n=1 Tax=[Actinomadura] parvosata TaxID=1955412 RepID=UPI0012BD77C1|nr:hypothetical protein [Nonomuraea sp. ATCC 55076]
MNVDEERTDLQHYLDGHRQRIEHLQARIDRAVHELRLHEMIVKLIQNPRLPQAVRGLAEMSSTASRTSIDTRDFLARDGVSVPSDFDISMQGEGDDFSVVITRRDQWYPAELSWSPRDGFQGRILNNAWREAKDAIPTEEA